jgi:hypothetical protein
MTFMQYSHIIQTRVNVSIEICTNYQYHLPTTATYLLSTHGRLEIPCGKGLHSINFYILLQPPSI